MEASPDPVARLKSHGPLTVVDLAINPRIDAFTISLTHLKMPVIAVPVRVAFKTLAIAQVSMPSTLILPPIRILHHSLPMSLLLNYHPYKDS